MKTTTKNISFKQILNDAVGDYMMLIKMRLTTLVVFTAVCSFIVASGLSFTMIDIVFLTIGGFCVTAASNAMNQVLEKDFDSLMTRTQNRPLPAGRMSVSNAVMFAGLMCMLGVTALAAFNVLTSFFGMLAFILYSFVYTPLKRYSSAAVFMGAIAGAMPMMIGVVAFTGSITWLALALFAIQFAWQYPHFWAIGYMGFEDYTKAGFKFVPMKEGSIDKSIAVSSVIYASVLLLIGVFMMYFGMIGYVAGGVMSLLAIGYLKYSVDFYKRFDMPAARKLMFSSLLYIPLVMIILIIDKL